jgi:hypothetical protein
MTVAEVATPESKAEETIVRRKYRNARDFIVYVGTQSASTISPLDRGNLLSVSEIDTTRVYPTYHYLSDDNRKWAEANHPGQWLRGFRAVRGFDIPSRPNAAQTLPNTDLSMWHVTLGKISDADRAFILGLEIVPIEDLDILNLSGRKVEPADLIRPENKLMSDEAGRLAQLVFNRVQISGQTVPHRAPERSAPTELHLQIYGILRREPLLCALCGGMMVVPQPNKLLKISGDRKDSSLGDYGPKNYQLVHLACNLAKNNATAEEFDEWLKIVRATVEDEMETEDEQ